MAQKHNIEYEEKPMTRDGRIQGPSRRYRRLRHPTFPAAEWTAKNPLLQRGEIGAEADTHRIKVGDGLTYWNDLPYASDAIATWGSINGNINDQTDLKNALDAKQDVIADLATIRSNASAGKAASDTIATYGNIVTHNVSEFATAAQGSLADTAVQPADLANYVTTNTTQTITGEKVFSGIMNYSAGKTYILAGNGGTKLGYWSYDIDGQSNITLQTMTASTRNINFKTNNGGKVTYNGSEIAKVSDLPGVMTGASAGDAGTSGLVPAPAAGDQAKFLQGDGTWANPTAAVAWGNITGSLSNQTDLKNALDAKQDVLTAGSNINITGTTISATDTTYTGSDGITLTGTNFTNSGVRSVATGSTNGTISVNTNGTSADVAVYGLGSAAYTASTNYATSSQGALADTAVQPGDLATVATTGDYDDLLNKPTIPTVNDATLTIQKNGTTVNTFTANASSNVTANITVPTKISDLTNDSNFANTDLSNLTDTGANIANWSHNVTNCITEIPQDIKLELSSGTLTLKAGSKCYLKTDTTTPSVNIASDLTTTQSTNGTYFAIYNGSALTTVLTTTYDYSSLPNTYSLPLAVITVSGGVITSIKQVFNGFGYIGSTVFALPGVKGLIPDGRNADGALKSIEVTVNNVLTHTGSYNNQPQWIILYNNSINSWDSVYWIGYNSQENILFNKEGSSSATSGSKIAGCVCAFLSADGNQKITSFTSKTAFHAVDYNDTGYVAHQAMPSAKYTNLTLGANGSSYTAPADGWFVLIKEATALYQYIDMSSAGGIETGATAAISGSQYLYALLPASKGSSISIYYTAAGSTIKFRFIYANGAA